MTSLTEFFNMILPFAYVLVLIALVWFIVELVFTVRRARTTVNEVKEKLDPTLDHVEKITASLEPAASKVDPLVDRVSLTVDAANLEIMRLDQILEDVNEITNTVSSAASAVDNITNAPLNLVSNVTSKIRTAFHAPRASDESVALGEKGLGDAAQEAVEGIKEAVQEQSATSRARKEERRVHDEEKQAKHAKTDAVASQMVDAVGASIEADTADIKERYFTYDAAQSPSSPTPTQSNSYTAPLQESVPQVQAGATNSPWPVSVPAHTVRTDFGKEGNENA